MLFAELERVKYMSMSLEFLISNLCDYFERTKIIFTEHL